MARWRHSCACGALRRGRWLLLGTLAAASTACGGKAVSSAAAGPGGAAGAAAASTAGSSAGGAAGMPAAGGAAGTGSASTVPKPSPCVFEADLADGLQRCSNGMLHRATPASCPSLLPLPDPIPVAEQWPADAGYPFECQRDSDCGAQPYGHCSAEMGLPACEYGCAVDSDCRKNQLCSCQWYGGRCIPATCRSDGNCNQGLCASDTTCSLTQFVCQRENDLCAGDSDCPKGQRCSLRRIDPSNPNSPLYRVCLERASCTGSTGAQ